MRIKQLLPALFLLTLFLGLPIGLYAPTASAAEKINLISRGDNNANYSIGLIKLALSKTATDYELNIQEGAHTAKRLQEALNDGSLDISWSATSIEQEAQAIPVRIPLLKGLMGYRVLLIHQANNRLFNSVNSMADLKQFSFGQGRGWPDTAIMQANGLNVIQATKYESLFFMTDGQRFDAFPRGIHEPWAEIAERPSLELAVDNHVLFVYRMPFYLFVSPKRPQLAKDLERGLLESIEDGSFDEYFYRDPTVQMVLDKVDFSHLKVFELANPTLPADTPIDNPKLWVSIDELKTKVRNKN